MTRATRLLPWLFPLLSCEGGATSAVTPRTRELGANDVAQVAEERIDAETVRDIASAQGVSLGEARDRAIRDALFAVEARARGRAPRTAESALLARELVKARRRELEGPITDAELASAKKRHWFDFDRPEGVRVVHVVAMTPEGPQKAPSAASLEKAEAVGKRIASAIGPAADRARAMPVDDAAVLAELKRIVAGIDAEGLETRTESLSPVAADGRVLGPGGGQFAVEFAESVASLRTRGEVTPPFRSPFGVHVAILLERTPAVALTDDEIRERVRDEVLDARVGAARRAMIDALSPSVEVETNAAALLDLVQVGGQARPSAEGTR